DDEPVVRLVVYHHLADEGYRLISASNGPEALDALDREAIDLVLLDVMMPRMSGYEVCRRIRETRSRDELPVLFLSAKSHTDDRVAGFEVGGNDYLVKPIARDELLARARAHLELSAMAKRQAAETRTLRGLLPICSSCKKIRDDGGYWKQVEVYISQHSGAQFSHGICPDCAAEMYSRLER
ncbi:MAG: response regulator, partial [Acidobacteriota bacterium]